MTSGGDGRRGAERLRAWRIGRGLSQSEAAWQIDVRQATWCGWESDDVRRGPNRDLAIRLEALTEGAVPIESWSGDPRVAEDMQQIVRGRVAREAETRSARAISQRTESHDHEFVDHDL